MKLEQRIELFTALGKCLQTDIASNEFEDFLDKVENENSWFIKKFVREAIQNIVSEMLQKEKLSNWLTPYGFKEGNKIVGLVLAGNIPLVGFHDILCVLISGNVAWVKLSSRDKILYEYLHKLLIDLEPSMSEYFIFHEQLKGADAYIATGSNNTARHFEYYFRNYPHIIRKNRTSVAVLNGKETDEELKYLAKDIFQYFGLGCRSINKLYLPKDYDHNQLMQACQSWEWLMDNNKYYNNYMYNKSILLVNNEKHLDTGFALFRPEHSLHSPISVVFTEEYDNMKELNTKLNANKEAIQVIASQIEEGLELRTSQLGAAQIPTLTDFADDINTLQFLDKL